MDAHASIYTEWLCRAAATRLEVVRLGQVHLGIYIGGSGGHVPNEHLGGYRCNWTQIGRSSCTEHGRTCAGQMTFPLLWQRLLKCTLGIVLVEQNTYSVATSRAIQKDWPKQLKAIKTLNRQLERGQHCSMIACEGGVQCIAWKDRKAIPIINTLCKPSSNTTVKRKMKDGTRITVACPEAVQKYNAYIGGVDISDQMRKVYSWREGLESGCCHCSTLSPIFAGCAVISVILREALLKMKPQTRPVQNL